MGFKEYIYIKWHRLFVCYTNLSGLGINLTLSLSSQYQPVDIKSINLSSIKWWWSKCKYCLKEDCYRREKLIQIYFSTYVSSLTEIVKSYHIKKWGFDQQVFFKAWHYFWLIKAIIQLYWRSDYQTSLVFKWPRPLQGWKTIVWNNPPGVRGFVLSGCSIMMNN